MQCPACNHQENRVTDSRESGDSVRRRRECLSCQHRFTTFERVEYRLPLVVKRDGRREPFDRDKLIGGMRLACRKRAVPEEALELIADQVERALARKVDRELPSTEIGRLLLPELQKLDPIAYVRFASVYLDIQSTEELFAVLSPLLEQKA
jgi:transcriptional repressor NrdR